MKLTYFYIYCNPVLKMVASVNSDLCGTVNYSFLLLQRPSMSQYILCSMLISNMYNVHTKKKDSGNIIRSKVLVT